MRFAWGASGWSSKSRTQTGRRFAPEAPSKPQERKLGALWPNNARRRAELQEKAGRWDIDSLATGEVG